MKKMAGYRFFRAILGPIYRFWYKPQIIGVENIPEEGPIILAGNHIHVMDQCNIIISTKRMLRYMAKKEYFDDKKVAWFFRLVGCIPVDRNTKDTNAKSKAIKVLEKGYPLGIYPEGTRNRLKPEEVKKLYNKYFKDTISFNKFKKELKNTKKTHIYYLEELIDKEITKEDFINNIYNASSYLKSIVKEDIYYENSLLPLKYGTVSMANKTNALIVPYAIVGEYKFRGNNLKVIIGKPFKVNDDLEKSNLKLRKEIIKLIRNND